jgi:hypothetical protein
MAKKIAPKPLNRLMPEELVSVRANQPLDEDGFHASGEVFQLRKERLAALGDMVTPVEQKKEAPKKG